MNECEKNRERIHQRLDGDVLPAAEAAALTEHLRTCTPCHELDRDLTRIQTELRGLPAVELPDPVLHAVWSRTVDRRTRLPRLPRFAAAAAVAALLLGGWLWTREPSVAPVESASTLNRIVIDTERVREDPAYAREIAEKVRRVLSTTSNALERTENTALREVFGDVSVAIDHVPVRRRSPTLENEL